VVVDDHSTGSKSHLNPGARLVEGSVTDLDLLVAVTKGADWVFHTAGWARIERSAEDPVGTHHVNVTGTLSVLQAARLSGVPKVVNSSSSSVYGDQGPCHVMQEGMKPNPRSPYAAQKLMGEQYAEMYARLFGLEVTSLRYFNVYGSRQPAEGAYMLLIPKFLKLRRQHQALTVYGDGNQTRGYTHVSDVVDANLLAASASLRTDRHTVLSIGPGEETSVSDIAAITGGPVEHVIPNPRGEFEESRKAADNSKAKADIGWEPKVSFADGIREIKLWRPIGPT
jgi:UDP-glucose 4-epimerase